MNLTTITKTRHKNAMIQIVFSPSLSTILISVEKFLPILRPVFPSWMDREILKLSSSSGIVSSRIWKGTGSSTSSGVKVKGMMLSIMKSSPAKRVIMGISS